jgi:hypothetical protein
MVVVNNPLDWRALVILGTHRSTDIYEGSFVVVVVVVVVLFFLFFNVLFLRYLVRPFFILVTRMN